MKVCEVLDDADVLQTDIKHNKGRAVTAIVRGAKRKSNASNDDDTEVAKETNTVMQ